MRKLHLALLSLTLAGCTEGAYTGQTVTVTSTEGYTLALNGRTDTSGAQINAYVHANPYGNPWLVPVAPASPTTGYTLIGSIPAGTTPYYQNDPTHPYYTWSMTSTPLSASPLNTREWRQGGLLHLRLRSTYSTNTGPEDMIAFDNESALCWQSEVVTQGQSWLTGITDCQSPYPINTARTSGGGHDIITMVSTTPTPAQQHDDLDYLGYRGGSAPPSVPVAPDSNEAKTARYYQFINAPLTFKGSGGFYEKYGFGLAGTDEVSAIYYNAGDLGIARDMHCKSFIPPQTVPPRGRALVGRVCYVTNYGRDAAGEARFGPENVDAQAAITQAVAGSSVGNTAAIATVAMVYLPPLPLQLAGTNVQFMVYNAKLGIQDSTGALQNFAALDNKGLEANDNPELDSHANINVPDNCLTCHGTSSQYTPTATGTPSILRANFLPFDPASMVFSTTNATYSKENMLPKLKALNAHVAAVAAVIQAPAVVGDPPGAIIDLLNGMYPSTLTPPGANGPAVPDTVFVDTYVPPGWTSVGKGATQLYNEVVKPYCRTCHVSHDTTGALDFLSYAEFSGQKDWINEYVCKEGSGPMPQAEQTQNRFWKSSARAHLVNALKLSGVCSPCYYGINPVGGECKTSP